MSVPADGAADAARREQCHVPAGMTFAEKWRLALGQWRRCRALPHAWVTADDEFGRVTAFRQELRRGGARYVLDVPCNTLLRDREGPRVVGPSGRRRLPPWEPVPAWAARQPSVAWTKVTVRAGEQGPVVVRALTRLVQTKDEDGRVGRAARLLVVRPVDRAGDVTYAVSNALSNVSWAALAAVKGARGRIEDALPWGKGEVGWSQYEVRRWVGWYHHLTWSLLALWFLSLEKTVVEKKRRGSRYRNCV